jgi:hypothetical protein
MRLQMFHLLSAGLALVLLGGMVSMRRSPGDAHLPAGPRHDAWIQVDKHLREGRPKSAVAALEGLVDAALADQAWAEESPRAFLLKQLIGRRMIRSDC